MAKCNNCDAVLGKIACVFVDPPNTLAASERFCCVECAEMVAEQYEWPEKEADTTDDEEAPE